MRCKSLNFLFFGSLILFLSCSDTNLPVTPTGQAPIGTGFFRVYENGQVGGVYGSPSYRNKGSNGLYLNYPAPNPTTGYFRVIIQNFEHQWMSIWIIKCAKETKDSFPIGIAKLNRIGAAAADYVLYDNIFSAGHFEFMVDLNQLYGEPEEGYYRIYLQTEDDLLWHDVYYTRSTFFFN